MHQDAEDNGILVGRGIITRWETTADILKLHLQAATQQHYGAIGEGKQQPNPPSFRILLDTTENFRGPNKPQPPISGGQKKQYTKRRQRNNPMQDTTKGWSMPTVHLSFSGPRRWWKAGIWQKWGNETSEQQGFTRFTSHYSHTLKFSEQQRLAAGIRQGFGYTISRGWLAKFTHKIDKVHNLVPQHVLVTAVVLGKLVKLC